MTEQKLSKVFQETLEGLQNGQDLEELLATYPDLADELRSLLQTTDLIPNARVASSELRAMRSRLDSQFEDQLAALNFPKKASHRPILTLVASLALVFLGIWVFFPRGDNSVATEIHLTQSTHIPTETATIAASPTTAIASHTPSPSPTRAIASNTASPTRIIPSATPSATRTNNPPTHEPIVCIPRTDWPEYQLESGDTLSEIALYSGTTVEALLLANCLESPRTLIVGQRIFVPRLWTDDDEEDSDDDNSDSPNESDDANDENDGSNSDDGDKSDEDNSGSDSDEDNSGSDSGNDNSGSGSDSDEDNSGSNSGDD